MASFIDKLVFPAPTSTYSRDSLKKNLCWIPWNEAISPDKVDDERYADGIPCMWLPAAKAAGVILFCHGNAEDLGMCFPFLRHMCSQFKMNVLAVEYPGYGLLNGLTVCEAALKEAALTAFRFILDELKVAYEQIILFGRSVGSGPSVYLASRFPVGGLILVAPFASVKEAAKSLVGSFIANVLEERFPNISLISNVSCPTLFIHGEKDTLVPPSHSVALFNNCRARKLLITPPGMEHNTNLFTDAQFLAIPAINFFGLPGYQQEASPQMPQRFFEDGRQAFLLRRSSRRKPGPQRPENVPSSPWFFLCGCSAAQGKQREGQPPMKQQSWPCGCDPYSLAEWDPSAPPSAPILAVEKRPMQRDATESAAQETAAAVAASRAGSNRSNRGLPPLLSGATGTGSGWVDEQRFEDDEASGWKCRAQDGSPTFQGVSTGEWQDRDLQAFKEQEIRQRIV